MADFTISLKAARVNAEITRAEAAAKIGVSEGSIINWETGRNKISFEDLTMLAKVYGCPIDLIRMPNSSQ